MTTRIPENVLATASIRAPTGHRIVGALASNRSVTIAQDGHSAGVGRWDGRHVYCSANLGDGSESGSEGAYEALDTALLAAVAELDGRLWSVDTDGDGDDELVVATDELTALAIVGDHAQPGASLDDLRARGWTAHILGT